MWFGVGVADQVVKDVRCRLEWRVALSVNFGGHKEFVKFEFVKICVAGVCGRICEGVCGL